MADWLTALLLGLVEGLTEFIPVYSTGHLLLLGHFLGFHSTGKTFEIVIQLGALLAIVSVYFKRLWTLATRWPFDAEARRFLIGLLVALGAPRRTILGLFLGEAVTLSALGGIVGLALGFGLAQLIHLLVPALPVQTPLSFVIYAELVAIVIGLLAGVLPARRAARLDPVEALRAE